LNSLENKFFIPDTLIENYFSLTIIGDPLKK